MSDTTTTPVFVEAKTRQAYKVTATATILSIHPGTCMLTETEKKPILDDALYEGLTSEGMAEYMARKDIENMLTENPKYKGIKMEDIKVTARPF